MRSKFLSTFFTFLFIFSFNARSQGTSALDLNWMKIKASTKEERTKIANFGVSIEYVSDDYVVVLANEKQKNLLQKAETVLVSFPVTEKMLEDFPPEDASFHNYQEVVQAINTLKQNYPDIVQTEVLGKSIEGRDIINIKIGLPSQRELEKPAVVFMGTHHAREHLSTEIPLMLAQYLAEQYHNGNMEIQKLLQTRMIYIIPMVNPDGVEYDISKGSYHMWRKNRVSNGDGTFGVDLNRNYGYKWGGDGSSEFTTSEIYRGPKPFSEPETQAIKNFIDTRKNITILLTFHTFAKLILYPWGYTYSSIQNDTDLKVHETMAKTMAQWNGYKPEQSSDLYLTSGDTTDWAYGEHKIISFTFEMDGSSFYPGQSIIPSVFKKNLQPCLYLISYADNPYRVLQPGYERLGFSSPLF